MQLNKIQVSLLALMLALLPRAVIAGQTTHTQETMTTAESNAASKLEAANNQFYTALNAMFVGEMELMNAIWSHRDDVTLLSPFGSSFVGWDAVGEEFQKLANVKLGGRVHCKDLSVHVGSDMGYALCVEEGQNVDSDGRPVKVYFRATNVFRLEDGEWKLVHHHTDTSQSLQNAAFGDESK